MKPIRSTKTTIWNILDHVCKFIDYVHIIDLKTIEIIEEREEVTHNFGAITMIIRHHSYYGQHIIHPTADSCKADLKI